ncbi:MAG: hypothetical protein ACKO14_03585 [Armatimonadota bacterium]
MNLSAFPLVLGPWGAATPVRDAGFEYRYRGQAWKPAPTEHVCVDVR